MGEQPVYVCGNDRCQRTVVSDCDDHADRIWGTAAYFAVYRLEQPAELHHAGAFTCVLSNRYDSQTDPFQYAGGYESGLYHSGSLQRYAV